MTLEIRLRPLSRADIDLHVSYIAHDRPASAERFARRVLETLDLLADHPNIGARSSTRSRLLRDLRRWPVRGFENHLIFYFARTDHLDIVRILHGAVDLNRVLRTSV